MSQIMNLKPQRRKFARTRISALCDVFFPDQNRIVGKGNILNFSQGGLRVIITSPVGRGRSVGINVDGLRQKKWIYARVANVRNVTEQTYSCGLQFEGLGLFKRRSVDSRLRRLARAMAA